MCWVVANAEPSKIYQSEAIDMACTPDATKRISWSNGKLSAKIFFTTLKLL
jgi:hypothetical protein